MQQLLRNHYKTTLISKERISVLLSVIFDEGYDFPQNIFQVEGNELVYGVEYIAHALNFRSNHKKNFRPFKKLWWLHHVSVFILLIQYRKRYY